MATSAMLQDDDGYQDDDRDAMDGQGAPKVECCIPVEMVKEDGIEPMEGDEVEFNVSGRVTKVVDGIACVQPLEINGEPVTSGSQEQQGPEDQTNDGDDDLDKLEAQAKPMLAARDKAMGF